MPVRFAIHKAGSPLPQFTPASAYALGQDGIPVPADIYFRDGLLTVARPDNLAVGVGLLWDVGPAGSYVLETARLKPAERPYLLNLELARGKLMRILQKMEDWNLFDFPRTEKLSAAFRQAQLKLAEALSLLPDAPGPASLAADEALAQAVRLGDELAMFHAELLLGRRRVAGTIARHVLGVRVEPELLTSPEAAPARELLFSGFDFAAVPTNWRRIQPAESEVVTAPLDQALDLITARRMPVVAGPLIDLQEANVPDWMAIWEHDFDTLRDLAYEHVNRIVQRYRRQVSAWNVVAGLHANSVFTLTLDQIREFTSLLVGQVKAALPAARTLVTIRQPFGEYHARYRSTLPPMVYAEMLAQGGIPFDAFGLELEMGIPAPGLFARDLFQISCLLDHFATLGKPVFLTALCASGRNYPDPADTSDGRLDPAAAGRWHAPWDADVQADWMDAVTRLALSKPFVESLAWSNLADRRPTLPAAGLLTADFQPKPGFHRLQQLRSLYHQWSGRRQASAS